MITPEQYAAAEWLVGPSVNAIASELDLTPIIVEAVASLVALPTPGGWR